MMKSHMVGATNVNVGWFFLRVKVLVKMPPGSELPELVHLVSQVGPTHEISMVSRGLKAKKSGLPWFAHTST